MERAGGQMVEYALTGRSTCKGCHSAIGEGELRIGHETASSFHDGFDTQWYHYQCFKRRVGARPLEALRHYQTLRWSDQQLLSKEVGGKVMADDELLRERAERLWKVKDAISAALKAKDVKAALEHNKLALGKASMPWLIHRLADGLIYGRIGLCPMCKSDALAHNSREYVCYGNVSEFTKCDFVGNHPEIVRYRWQVPAKGAPKFLAGFEFGKDHPTEAFVALVATDDNESSQDGGSAGEKRAAEGAKTEKTTKGKKARTESTTGVQEALGPQSVQEGPAVAAAEAPVPAGKEMHGMRVALVGTKGSLGSAPAELKALVEAHGGSVVANVTADISCVVAGQADVAKAKAVAKIAKARELGVAIMSPDWLRNLCNRTAEGTALRTFEGAKSYALEAGKGEAAPEKYRLAQRYTAAEPPGVLRRAETGGEEVNKYRAQPVIGCDLLKVPTSYTGNGKDVLVTHDGVFGYTAYNAVLNQADVASGVNKCDIFYQAVIVVCAGGKFDFFCKWGRIGVADKGGETLKTYGTQAGAIDAFVEKWEKFVGFRWDKRYRYRKQPGKYLWVLLDDGIEATTTAVEKKAVVVVAPRPAPSGSTVALDTRVRELLELIFDKEMMQQTLVRFNVDIKKMPLGKINPAQIREAYRVLSNIAGLMAAGNVQRAQLVDTSNRFYTLIPCDFGSALPPLIDSLEAVKTKLELVEALIEIENAVEIMSHDSEGSDPATTHYRQLRSRITPLDPKSDRFELLERYVVQGHDSSLVQFTPRVRHIFEIQREDEDEKLLSKWIHDPNRMLLWHGSRLSNWVGIISKGLRIAPPEAPSTGYRLGKGVYLANTVSKSASYCFTDASNPTGVMLLAEAALGKQFTTTKDHYMDAAQPGFDSTYATGAISPDPNATASIEAAFNVGAVKVPCGAPKPTSYSRSNFTHDEFVVYDTTKVKMRYVLIVDMDHNVGRKKRR